LKYWRCKENEDGSSQDHG